MFVHRLDSLSSCLRHQWPRTTWPCLKEDKFHVKWIFIVSSSTYRFQKTESVFKTTAEKTTSILGGFGSGLSMKLGQMRNSDSFRSLEERVGSAYENMKVIKIWLWLFFFNLQHKNQHYFIRNFNCLLRILILIFNKSCIILYTVAREKIWTLFYRKIDLIWIFWIFF